MLKVATVEDFDIVMNLVMKFAEHSNYYKYVNKEKLEGLVLGFLQADKKDKLILLYGDIGMLVAIAMPFIFGDVKIATEIGWWVNPDERGHKAGEELLTAFEYWAKEIGCDITSMTCLDDRVGKYYEKKGYTLYERAYFKEL